MQTQSIVIDLDVYKAIENRRQSFSETHNDILHRLLLDKAALNDPAVEPATEQGGLRIRHDVYLPAGTQLRHIAKRSGQRYDATVVDGGIQYGDAIYQSPSKAAIAAAGNNRNGWIFWEYMNPITQRWILLDSLREEK